MRRYIFVLFFLLFITASCKEYLSIKPDKKLAVPSSGRDLQALLDYVTTMNYGYISGLGEIGSDNILLIDNIWSSISIESDRLTYIWENFPVNQYYWTTSYSRTLTINNVFDNMSLVNYESSGQQNEILGSALFFRGYTYFDIAQVFTVPYQAETANNELGVVLRLSSDVNLKSRRSTLQETYDQIVNDLKAAVPLLSSNVQQYPTRPNKASAYGALARTHLAMRDYEKAGNYADSCLQLINTLIDYNNIPLKAYPFDRFNKEVIFYSQMRGESALQESRARIDSSFYETFDEKDLRKKLFFTKKADGYYSFTGDYSQSTSVVKFNGITTAEMFFIRAECLAREGKVDKALQEINWLLSHRYDKNNFIPLDITDSKELLKRILDERRKELVFRGLRWGDLRRLSFEEEIGITVKRSLKGHEYLFSPNEQKKFAYFIPQMVIERSGIEQNK